MAEEHKKCRKAQLALAISRGVSAGKWAQINEVPKVTAYRWAKDPAVRKAVDTYRRRMIDQTVGMLTRKTAQAAGEIFRVAMRGESDSVRLKACRAIISDMITASKYSVLEGRLLDIEERLDEQEGDAAGAAVTTYPPR